MNERTETTIAPVRDWQVEVTRVISQTQTVEVRGTRHEAERLATFAADEDGDWEDSDEGAPSAEVQAWREVVGDHVGSWVMGDDDTEDEETEDTEDDMDALLTPAVVEDIVESLGATLARDGLDTDLIRRITEAQRVVLMERLGRTTDDEDTEE